VTGTFYLVSSDGRRESVKSMAMVILISGKAQSDFGKGYKLLQQRLDFSSIAIRVGSTNQKFTHAIHELGTRRLTYTHSAARVPTIDPILEG
jgi:hypothetical protein